MTKVNLYDVAKFINGYAFKPSDWHGEGRKIIRIQNLTNEAKEFNRTNTDISEKYRVKKGDVLVSWSATLDVFEWQEEEDAWLNQHIFKIDHDRKLVDKYYLKCVLKQTLFKLGRYSHGSTMKHVVRSDFLNHKIPIVSLSEQTQIVKILDTANDLRQKRKEQLNLLDDYLKSVFFEMFGDYIEKDDHRFVHLEKLTKKVSVGHVGPTSFAYVDNGVPFLRTQNVKKNFIDLSDLAFVNHDFHKKLRKSQITSGDILISRVGVNRGMAAVVPENLGDANCANVVIVRNSSQFNSIFLAFYLNYTYGKSAKFGYSVGSAQGVVNTSIVKKWPIIDVKVDLQNKFASIVEQVEQTKQKMHASLDEMDNHFNALMQRYFG